MSLAAEKKKIKMKNKGFTLLELMVTTAIVLIITSGLIFTFINCLMINEASNNLVIAANDAQYVLEDIKSLVFTDLSDIESHVWTFANLNQETISTTHSDISSILKEITVNVSWTVRQKQVNWTLSTLIVRQSGS